MNIFKLSTNAIVALIFFTIGASLASAMFMTSYRETVKPEVNTANERLNDLERRVTCIVKQSLSGRYGYTLDDGELFGVDSNKDSIFFFFDSRPTPWRCPGLLVIQHNDTLFTYDYNDSKSSLINWRDRYNKSCDYIDYHKVPRSKLKNIIRDSVIYNTQFSNTNN